jgi:ADP-heptose:LPS heptosyltransferase
MGSVPDSPRRILVIAEGQLGDLLILTPALRALKDSFPDADLTALVVQRRSYDAPGTAAQSPEIIRVPNGGTSEVLLNDPHVNSVVEIDRARLRALSFGARVRAEAEIVSWLRHGEFDTVLCTFPQDRFFQWAFLSGAGVRIGGEEGGAFRSLLNRRIQRKKSDGGVLKYYCALAEAAGARVDSYETRFEIPESASAWADGVLRSLGLAPGERPLLVHPGASGAYRIWPPEYFATLIDSVQAGVKRNVLLCGSAFDRDVVEDVRKRCLSDVRVQMTDGGVSQLAALLARSALCLSNNSGPRHLAISVGTPSLAVIPRYDDVEWKIYDDELRAGTVQSSRPCSSCGTDACFNRIPEGEAYGSFCMRDVPPDDVGARIFSLLAAHK